jgi:cyanophycinase
VILNGSYSMKKPLSAADVPAIGAGYGTVSDRGAAGLDADSAAPALKTPVAAMLHVADTLGFLEATQQMARMPGVSNFVTGGGNQHCSSFNGDLKSANCSADWTTILAQDPAFAGLSKAQLSFDASYPFPDFSYSITQAGIARLNALPASLFDRGRKAAVLEALAARLAGAVKKTALSFSDFDGSPVAAGLTASLTPPEKAVLRSVFVDPNPQTSRKFEARSIQFLSDKATYDITTQFVKAASALNGGKTPLIGVVTAASGNPFLDRDINVSALASAGADVVYLPLDGGLRQALDANDCANTRYYYDSFANTHALGDIHHMDQVYPDLAKQQQDFCANGGATLNAALHSLHGIYFSGGDQARLLESFITKDAAGAYTVVSEQARILQTRFAAGQLVVSGTSAGNHIQGGGLWKGKPVPMLGGGNSYPALKKGFADGTGPVPDAPQTTISYSRGGLGFFNYGVLDSHFSRRTREGRLIRATKESGMDYGFGIDENTALVVGRPDANGKTAFAVIGAAGVFIADVRGAAATGTAGETYSIDGVTAHYLTAGDAAEIDASGHLSVTLSASKPLLPASASQPAATQDRIQDVGSSNFLNLATAMGVSGAASGLGTTENGADGTGDTQDAPRYAVTLTRSADTVFRGLDGGRVSYSNLTLKMAPCHAS